MREIASAGDLAAAVADWKKAGHALIPLGVRRAGQLSFVAVKVDG